jgi:hypothetical protein
MRILGVLVNLALRLWLAYFLAEVLRKPNDPRFAGKAIPLRNLIIVGSLSMLFPVLHSLGKRWSRYPIWHDNLYLSLFWLDMAGNSFDLYDRYFYFDLIPHFHGTGAAAATLYGAFQLDLLGAIGLANILHLLLEIQEYYTDVLFKTHNVRGTFDVINDLAAGLLGTVVYAGLHRVWRDPRRKP